MSISWLARRSALLLAVSIAFVTLGHLLAFADGLSDAFALGEEPGESSRSCSKWRGRI